MSKLAHSCQETMDEIERQAREDDERGVPSEPPSWWCEPCKVEVYARRCPHCGKLEKDRT